MIQKSKPLYNLKFWSSLCFILGLFSGTLSLRLPVFCSSNPDISLFISPNSSDFTESFDFESFRFGSIFRERNLTRAFQYDSAWYRTSIVMILGSIDEAVGSLVKISRLKKSANETMSAKLLLIIPEVQDLFNQSKHSATEIIRRKFDHEDLRLMFDLRATLLLAFYTVQHKISEDSPTFNIWEFYTIKNKSFARQIAENASETQLSALLEAGSQLSRRQDWNGVDIVAAGFIVSGDFGEDDKGNEHAEIHGVTKYELNVMKNKGTHELILKPSLSARIFWDIELALNFTAKLLRPFQYSDGFDNVILKHGHEFDIIISHFTLVPQKMKHAQNLAITYFNSISAFFIQPPAHSFRNIYATPFTMEMWAMIILTWASIGLSFHGIRWVRRLSINANEVDPQELEFDEQVTNDWLWWAIAAACQQGWYTSPKTTPSRVVFCTGLLFSLVCYAAYTATIVSELWDTVVPIRNLEALMSNSKYIYVESQSDIADIVIEGLTQRNTDLLSKVRVINLTQATLSYMDSSTPGCFLNWPEYFIDDAKAMIEKIDLSSNIEVQFCDKISSFPYKYIPVKASMFVQKGSPFTEIFNYRILISAERGLLNRHWKEYIHNTEIKCLLSTNTTYALGIYDTWAVFAVLIAGYVASLVILAFELVMCGVHLQSA